MKRKTETQIYFVPPFLRSYKMDGSLVVSMKTINDPLIKKEIEYYLDTLDLERFVFSIVARYNEIKEKNKLPFQINYHKKIIGHNSCPYGCENQDINCIDCVGGSHFVPKRK